MAETENNDTMNETADTALAPAEPVIAPAPTNGSATSAPEAVEAAVEAAQAVVAEGAAEPAAEGAEELAAASAAPELPENEMSFAEMFELAEKQSRDKQGKGGGGKGGIRSGKIVNATVVGFSHDSVFVDLGGKAEGVIPRADVLVDGELTLKEGDEIEARVISTEGGQVRLGKALGADSVKNREAVRDAFESGLPVEGRVTGKNKGGLEVEVGGLRAFCPISQIDVRFCKDPTIFIGQKLVFRVMEFKKEGRNVVVSRRVILEEEQKKAAAELIEKLAVGTVVIGEVTSLKDYGAFVDIGGLEGLVHVSQITHGRINKPSEKLSVGQQMDVQIIKIEEGKNGQPKISLSMKALERDPWDEAKLALKEGQKVTGKVQRIQPFGAFVEVMPGVDGLIHVSNMSNDRISDPGKVVQIGQEVEATIIGLDWSKRRVGLSLVKTRQQLAKETSEGTVLEGTIDKIEGFGLFVKLPTGARGLVPAPETGTQRGADLTKEFKVGGTVKVTVLESDKKTGKIRLSIKRAAEAEERAMFSTYMNQAGANKGLGTLGDLFKSVLKK